MSKSAAEREARGRAGEFRVASELCRRKMFASLTMGNVPNVDVLCANSDRMRQSVFKLRRFGRMRKLA